METLEVDDTPKMSLVVEGKYKITAKLGEGSFGKIYKGINVNTEEEIAIKIEKASDNSMLKTEAKIYKLLENTNGIPKLRSYGQEGNFNYMVMDLLGNSLEDLRIECGGRLSLKSVLAIGIQLLKRIELIHNEGIIHRDIKPDNFLIKPENNMVYMIDFGLARRYITKRDHHISMAQGRKLTGTARYASVNVHLGMTPSRRDDLESIAYVLLYLLNGKLPWQAIKCSDKEKRYEAIGQEKLNVAPWTHFETSPGEFILFLKYCRGLDFDEDPDYNYLRNLLGNLYKHHGFEADNLYDWS